MMNDTNELRSNGLQNLIKRIVVEAAKFPPLQVHISLLVFIFWPHPGHAGTLPDIAANTRPLRAWLKCRTITTHACKSVVDLSRNCEGFRARESVHARVTEQRAQGTGVGRDIRQSPSRVRSVFLLIYASGDQWDITHNAS